MTKIQRQAEIHSKIRCFLFCFSMFVFGMTFLVLGFARQMRNEAPVAEIETESEIMPVEVIVTEDSEVEIEENKSIEVSQPYEEPDIEKTTNYEVEEETEQSDDDDFILIETTAYLETGNNTASGVYPKVNHTVAMARQYIGRELELYYKSDDGSVGNLIGRYKVEDTGGDYRIKNGTVIDIYFGSDRQGAIEWGRRKVYMRWIS